MSLKRKRCTDELSPTSTSSSSSSTSICNTTDGLPSDSLLVRAVSTSPLPVPRVPLFGLLQRHHPPGMWIGGSGSRRERASDVEAHSDSRTRKRWRDNRPDEATVHRNTLHKLFAAQQHSSSIQNTPFSSLPEHDNTEISSSSAAAGLPLPLLPVQKTSLHSFWNINTRVSVPLPANDQDMLVMSGNGSCEDCDAPLCDRGRGSMHYAFAFEDDGAEGAEWFSCSACAKYVCDRCAVVRDSRVCLDCVMLD